MDLQPLPTDPLARATIEAAWIGAEATGRAAWMQAFAALGAIVAGGLAYFGAVRQVRLQERAHEARAIAYRFRLGRIVQEYLAQISNARAVARQQLESYRAGGGSARITSFRIARPQTLHDDNWEAHALLGRRAVELILTIDEHSRRLAEFDKEIGRDTVRTDTHFEAGTLAAVEQTIDGEAGYRPENAIADYVRVLNALQQALAALGDELAKPLLAPPWRMLLQRIRSRKSAAAGR
jgi:hypothetical protein